jgi:hypothetical protein
VLAALGDKVTPLNGRSGIELHQDGLVAMVQGVIDENNEFHASLGKVGWLEDMTRPSGQKRPGFIRPNIREPV